MKLSKQILTFLALTLAWHATTAYAQTIKGRSPSNVRILALSENGSIRNNESGQKFSFSVEAKSSVRLLVQDSNSGKLLGPLITGIKAKNKTTSYSEAKKDNIFSKTSTSAVVSARAVKSETLNLGKIKEATKNDQKSFYVKRLLEKRNVLTTNRTSINENGIIKSAGTFGLSGFQINQVKNAATSDGLDQDSDGFPDLLDIDDDNDGTLDAYDEAQNSANPLLGAKLFSNLKVNIIDSLNINANPNITDEQIDSLVKNNLTLAIPVSSTGTGETSELDCTGVPFCDSAANAIPLESTGVFPRDFDTDGDGFGSITKGNTQDFQLKPNVSTSEIGSGDLITEVVTDSTGRETRYPRLLEFVFNTTPALKSISIKDGSNIAHTGSPYTISYPLTNGASGTNGSCFRAPASGDVKIEITAWRPQRKGIAAAGETTFVDIGKSIITIDIPNAPCVVTGNAGCSGTTGSACSASQYSSSDSNLSTTQEGLKDNLGDLSSDAANVFNFNFNVTGCLSEKNVNWSSGETLSLDLMLKNTTGDNAAQKFCIVRD